MHIFIPDLPFFISTKTTVKTASAELEYMSSSPHDTQQTAASGVCRGCS